MLKVLKPADGVLGKRTICGCCGVFMNAGDQFRYDQAKVFTGKKVSSNCYRTVKVQCHINAVCNLVSLELHTNKLAQESQSAAIKYFSELTPTKEQEVSINLIISEAKKNLEKLIEDEKELKAKLI